MYLEAKSICQTIKQNLKNERLFYFEKEEVDFSVNEQGGKSF
jgi:hypothetical protein